MAYEKKRNSRFYTNVPLDVCVGVCVFLKESKTKNPATYDLKCALKIS